ncbi:tetratricopeptide repeat protein [Nonomuraea wenchangensis]
MALRRRRRADVAQAVDGSTVHGDLVQANVNVSGVQAHIDQRTILAPVALAGRDLYQYTASFSGPAPVPPLVRYGLARDLTDFTGRGGELQRLLRGTRQRPSVITIDGMPGVGKTALATHAAHLLSGDFPDGRFYVSLRAGEGAAADPAEVLESLLRDMGVRPEHVPPSLEGRARLWRDRTAARRVLLVLDDAVGHEQIEPLLPAGSGCLTLVTSRRRLEALDGAVPLSLGELPPEEAAELFVRVSRRPASGSDAVAEIVDLCGRLPLAIVLAAGRLAHRPSWSVEEFAAALRAADDRLGQLAGGPRTVRLAFEVSYRSLPAAEQFMFRRLGLHPGPDIDVGVAAAAAGVPSPEAARELDSLYVDHLLEETAPGRFRLHALLGVYARELSEREDTDADREAAMARIVARFEELGRDARTPDLMRAHYANVVACAEWAASQERWPVLVRLVRMLAGFMRGEGLWRQAAVLHGRAADAAALLGDGHAEADALLELGWIEQAVGEYGEARLTYERAMSLFRGLGDQRGEARALNDLGWVAQLTGDLAGAERAHQGALDLFRAVGDGAGEAGALNQMGRLKQAAGDYRDAARMHNRALKLFRALADRAGEAHARTELAWSLSGMPGWSPAPRKLHEQSLELFREVGHRLGVANASYGLSWHMGSHDRTRDGRDRDAVRDEALAIYRDLGSRLGEAIVLNDMGSDLVYSDPAAAIGPFEQAGALFRELGNLAGEAKALEGIGRSYHRKLDFVRARDSFERALALYQALSDADAVSIVERWLDEIQEAIDDYAASRGRLDRLVERGLGWLRVPDPLVVAAQRRARKQERRRLEYERRYRFHR